jgi:hypothetical protein
LPRPVVAGLIAIGVAGSAGIVLAAAASAAPATATLYVDPSGTSGACTSTGTGACATIQQAINAAEAAGYAGTAVTIDVTPGTYTGSDTITGGSEQTLTILPTPGAAGAVTLDGGGTGSVLTIDFTSLVQLDLDSLTITGGRTSGDGGGIDNQGQGIVVLNDSTVADNEAVGSFGSNAYGGGIANDGAGTFDITNTTITDNRAAAGAGVDGVTGSAPGAGGTSGQLGGDGDGGGVANLGSGLINMNYATVSDNTASAGNGGAGGAGAQGSAGVGTAGDLGGSGGDGGTGGDALGGGLIADGGTILIDHTTINDNQAVGGVGGTGGAGGAGGSGDTGVDGGGSPGGTGLAGGAGGAGGNGEVGGNAYGGGVMVISGTVQVQGTTVNGNSASAGSGGSAGGGGQGGYGGAGGAGVPTGQGGQGGDGGQGGNAQYGGDAYGGGVDAQSNVAIGEVTDAYNGASGGDGGNGGKGGTGGTGGSGSSAGTQGDGGNAGDGSGGGVSTGGGVVGDGGNVQILNSTISEDAIPFAALGAAGLPGVGSADGNPGAPGSAGYGSGGAIYSVSDEVSVGASIVAGNDVPECSGSVADLGYNLTEEAPGASTCGLSTANNDVMGVATPVMGALQDNGGPTQTMLPNSQMAIAIPNPTTIASTPVCPDTDQRGVPGPIPGQSDCTIGAVEDIAGQAPAVSSGSTTPTYTLGAPSQQAWPDTLTVTAIPSVSLTETGSLPSGVLFSTAAGSGTFDEDGTFSGTPVNTGVFPVTLSAANYLLPNLGASVTLTVNQQTSTGLALGSGTAEVGQSVTYVATVGSEVALSGGTVAFSDSLGAISGCGSQPLTAQSSTAATASCTTHAFAQAGADQVKASFSGDTEDLASSGSQTTQVAALPITTTTTTTTPAPAPKRKRKPTPSIRASMSSSRPKGAGGWWRAAVTVRFRCSAGGGKLKGGCPAPVRLSKSGRGQSLRRTVRDTSGRSATVRVRGINIDRTLPRVRITGPISGGTFALTAPKARCAASDRVSGIKSCALSEHAESVAGGYRVSYLARALSRSGASTTARAVITVTTISIQHASLVRPNAWSVTPGNSYVLQVLSETKPEYLDAAPSSVGPTGPYDYFFRAGTVNGVPLWDSPVKITAGFARFPSWTIGVRTGTRTVWIKLLT